MDIAVFALAVQASRLGTGRPVTAPRRIFFVVDRRVIVDEAYARARRMAAKLAEADAGILKDVADNLRRVVHGAAMGFDAEAPPLAVHALRGGMYRSEAWLRNPLQPAVVASTVDQLGSRLLFRAYGRGSATWPVCAALAANDSLVLLDEAHCARPFLQTLQAVRRYREWADVSLNRCFHPVVMSATPPAGLDDVFVDASGEGRDPNHLLGRRQLASKLAKLRVVVSGENFSARLTQSARSLLVDGRRAVVVFVNRVATAREAHRQLLKNEDIDAVLLTGRMRPLDKDATIRKLRNFGLHSDSSANRRLEKPVVVVATQTLEVGADLDFDGLVTECASLDALRQRFGRLNRTGRRTVDARAEILIRGDQVKPARGEDDPVYGKALTKTWQWLNARKSEDGEVDFGIAALDRMLGKLADEDSLADLNAPSDDALVMLPAHVDCLAQTAPQPRPTPDVSHFLHGPRESAPDVLACWRADIDLDSETSQDEAIGLLTLCPPCGSEALPVPIGVFKRWLAGRAGRDVGDLGSDVEGVGSADDGSDAVRGGIHPSRRVIRWWGNRTNADPNAIRPGDIVVIPCGHPGDPRDLGDIPQEASDGASLDVGDGAHRMARAKPILRLHPALVETWPDSFAAKATARSLLDGLARKYEDDPHEVAETVDRILAALSRVELSEDEPLAWLPRAAKELKKEFRTVAQLRRECRIVGSRSLVLAGRRRVDALVSEATLFSDEDDAAASGISHKDGEPVPLCTHLQGVETFARRHAQACGLPEDLTEAIARAGLLHDLGKADLRFQAMLRGGSPWFDGESFLAKSARMPKTRAARESAHAASGYPQGARHELLSVRLAEATPALLPDDGELRDLVLHLVASHHGHCRPFAPVVIDDSPVSTEYALRGHRMRWIGPTGLERLDSGVAERYWRLTRRYGWWGLAWLEALLRLADWRRSEWEEAHDADDADE